MYAKLIGGSIRSATEKFNTPEEYLAAGYLPVTFTDPPNNPPVGYEYEFGWEQTDDAIVQTWTLTPLPDDIDEAEAFDIIFGGAE